MKAAVMFIILLFPFLVLPHGGGVKKSGCLIGCHNNKKAGGFHCHGKSSFEGKSFSSESDAEEALCNKVAYVKNAKIPHVFPESAYQQQWCLSHNGTLEVSTNRGRVDCLTKEYAIEFDWGHKWGEAIQQSTGYAEATGKKAAIILILDTVGDKNGVDSYKEMRKNNKNMPELLAVIDPTIENEKIAKTLAE